jgi:gliding motility-associated-like protein
MLVAQDRSNRGREFWVGYGHNALFTMNPPNSQQLVLYLSAEQSAKVTVSVYGTTWRRDLDIPANTVDFSVILPKSGPEDARLLKEGKSGKGIHIESDVPIVVYAHQFGTVSSGATMLMPVDTYGYRYFSLNFTQNSNYPDSYSWFYVIAPEDDTRIEITPSKDTEGGWQAGKTYTVELDRGEIYNVFGKKGPNAVPYPGNDMSGSKVVSVEGQDGKCHPIAMFSGSSRLILCNLGGGEVMQQQVFPANTWGTRYLTYRTQPNIGIGPTEPFLNFYRVAVQDPATVVKRNGVAMTGLKDGFYYEFGSTTGDYIESDKPILVSQVITNQNQCDPTIPFDPPMGDPEMFILSPLEQGIRRAVFYNTRNQSIELNFVNVIFHTAAYVSLRIDGNPVDPSQVVAHPVHPDHYVAVIRLIGAAAQHVLTCDSVFTAITYGMGYVESYGYNAGTMVNNLNAYSSIRNSFSLDPVSDSFTCVKTAFRPRIRVAYRLTGLRWKLSGVSNLSPSADVDVVSPVPVETGKIYGRTYYTYVLDRDLIFDRPGSYEIPVVCTSPEIDQCDFTETVNVSVTVRESPKADFDASGSYCLKDTVVLKGAVSYPGFTIDRYRWDFADLTTQDNRDARKKFASKGDQPVRYRVITANGCTGDTTKTVKVVETPSVTVSMTGKPCVDSMQRFVSSYAGTGHAWYWNFGDGRIDSSRSSAEINHAYRTAATDLRLRHWVVTAQGCASDTSLLTIARVHPNPQPVDFTIVSDSLCPGTFIRFSASSSGGVAGWQWDFGNGERSSAASPVQSRYDASGDFITSLRITDANGCGSSAMTKPVRISPTPRVDAGVDRSVLKGQSVRLSGSVTGAGPFDYAWSPPLYLDNPAIPNPLVTPLADIGYSLKVTDRQSGCSGSDSVKVSILEKFTVPNTFTPNGDGINDRWEIASLGQYQGCVVEVYNVWGQRVYRSVGYASPWDGTANGRKVPAGTYYYVIEPGSGEKRKAGYVTVLR